MIPRAKGQNLEDYDFFCWRLAQQFADARAKRLAQVLIDNELAIDLVHDDDMGHAIRGHFCLEQQLIHVDEFDRNLLEHLWVSRKRLNRHDVASEIRKKRVSILVPQRGIFRFAHSDHCDASIGPNPSQLLLLSSSEGASEMICKNPTGPIILIIPIHLSPPCPFCGRFNIA